MGITGPTFLVTDPADIGYCPSENHDVRVVRLDRVACPLILIIGLGVYSTGFIRAAIPAIATVCPIKPVFEQRAIVGD